MINFIDHGNMVPLLLNAEDVDTCLTTSQVLSHSSYFCSH